MISCAKRPPADVSRRAAGASCAVVGARLGPAADRAFAFAFALLLAPGCGQPEGGQPSSAAYESPHGEAIEEARALLDSLMDAEWIPGLSVAVGRGSQLIWSEGLGFSDLTHNVRVTPLTRFRVGSVSKPITAAALAVLVEAGRLDLDAPVQDYVPSFPEKRWPVTTRQLAGHLGGIRHYRGMENFSRTRYPTVLSGLAIFADDSLINEPGTEYSYSSYAWNLISAVVAGAAGEGFLEYMDRVVFEPLGMDRTEADRNGPVIPDRTRFYVADSTGQVFNAPYVDNSYKWAGGGFLSTPEDMLVFANAHLEPGFLQAGTIEMLFTSQRLRDGAETGYGIGWRSATNEHGERIVSHTGGSVGGRTVLTLNRDSGLIVAIAANLSGAPIGNALAARIEEIFRSGAEAN